MPLPHRFFLFAFLTTLACTTARKAPIPPTNLGPWCILGFDALNRTPQQRIALLQDLGFTRYGFNKGKGHLDELQEEFALARANDIEITSVFLWLNADRDTLGRLSPDNQSLLRHLGAVEQRPAIWLSFSDNYFKDLDQAAALQLAEQMITFVLAEVAPLGSDVALYNHHGWFGNPDNQLALLERLPPGAVSIVFNFHHAQAYAADFPRIAERLVPRLSFVNISGVNTDGPRILPIGAGEHEYDMLRTLLAEGYRGPWGILGHVKTEDVRVVLERNLAGLEAFNVAYQSAEAE